MESVSWTRYAALALLGAGLAMASGCSVMHDPVPLETEGDTVPIPELTPAEKADLAQMAEPQLRAREEAFVLNKYANVDPGHIIPDAMLSKALTYFDANQAHIPNKTTLTIVDFTPFSGIARMYVIDMASGSVWTLRVAHGSGSDPKHTGYATKFSNTSGSLMSSLGFYRTAEIYTGKHGVSLRLDGLSSTNSNVRARAIVVHSAAYVVDKNVNEGRSNGCFAVSLANKDKLLAKIKNGSLIYAATR
jgi:hypothetical protein